MLMLRPAAAVLTVLSLGCGTATSARPEASSSPSQAVSATPTLPAGAANVYHGAVTTIRVPGRKPGTLFVDVEAHQTASGTTITLRAIREVDCHVDKAQTGAPLYVCTTKWDRRKVVPASAFTYDGMLGTATVTTTVDGKPFKVTWTGYGAPRQQVNENGALLIRNRDAKADATWGTLRYTDPDDTKAPSLLYHRVTR